jgi:hypothetical protein
MIAERIVRIVAGSFVLVAVLLGAERSPVFVSSAFLWVAAFVGLNLFQSGFTRFCPLEILLRRLGWDARGR